MALQSGAFSAETEKLTSFSYRRTVEKTILLKHYYLNGFLLMVG